MKGRITAAFMGALLTTPFITACSDNNSKNYDNEAATENTSETSETTTEITTEKATTTVKTDKKNEKKDDIFSGLEVETKVSMQNRSQVLFVMDDGSYVYPMFKNGSDGPVTTYVISKKGEPKELNIPENSAVYYSDGKKLYYYSPDDGLCEYNDGKSSALNKETKTQDGTIPLRESYLFTDDAIYFALTDDKGTKIRSMDYSGKLSDETYSIDKKNATIIGIAEMDGDDCMLCGYSYGTSEIIAAIGSDGSIEEVSSGTNAYISEDNIYYIRLAQLYRKPLVGGNEVKVSEERCADYCFIGDKLYISYATDVYSLDKNGKAKKIFGVDKLTKCACISHISSVGDKLFVNGVEGAFWSCIAEIDKDGKLIKEYQNGIER